MDKYRDGAALRAALSEADAFIKQLEAAIKDEKEAQRMYEEMTRLPIKLDRVDSVFKSMNMQIAGVRKDEGRHEHIFTEMLRETREAKKRIVASHETEQRKAEEDRRKRGVLGRPIP